MKFTVFLLLFHSCRCSAPKRSQSRDIGPQCLRANFHEALHRVDDICAQIVHFHGHSVAMLAAQRSSYLSKLGLKIIARCWNYIYTFIIGNNRIICTYLIFIFVKNSFYTAPIWNFIVAIRCIVIRWLFANGSQSKRCPKFLKITI